MSGYRNRRAAAATVEGRRQVRKVSALWELECAGGAGRRRAELVCWG
jgi:hypothetical protein